MRVLIGAVLLSSATFSFFLVLLWARNPRRPKWASDALIGNLYCPLLVSSGIVGIALFVSGLYNFSAYGSTLTDALLAAAILSLTAIGVKAMKVKARLAAYERPAAETKSAAASQDKGTLPDTIGAGSQATG